MESKENWNYRVLIVDDEEGIHSDFKDMLNPNGTQTLTDQLAEALLDENLQNRNAFLPPFELLHATSGEEAYDIIRTGKASNRPIAVVYIDVRMPPGIDGVEAIRRIRQIEKDIELVIMTAYTDKPLPEIIRDMELLHKLLYIRKPFAPEEVQQITLALVEKWNIEQELAKKQQQIVTNHQNLEISHQRLETVLNSAADAIGMFNDEGHLLFANQYYQQLFDLTEDQLRQMSPDDLSARMGERFQETEVSQPGGAHAENLENMVEEIGDASESGPRLFYRSITPVWNNQGDSAGNVVSYRDMSKEVEIQQMKAEVLRLRTELETTYSFGEIVGKSDNMQQTFALMQRATESDITVLISGESGTGKELVARAIHFNSSRKAGPFVTVNCAAIPETLIESELFGHERGAFTGATAKRIGKFEHANRGTIFLDEIGDMELPLQAKLLRVLQERRIQRVGGTANIPIDIRVLTATNQSLEAAVEAGIFRKDLFYRIATFPIAVPPLKDRYEDIPLLANHFLKKYAENTKKSIKAISPAALRLLMQHDFPGNVRELENIIERAVLLETTELLQPSSLPTQISSMISSQPILLPSDSTEILPFEEVERQTLAHALKVMDNNVAKTAQALKIARSTLYRKLKLYQLSEPD
jgi:transcriptional regulator with PAS, ATPase and Fis domain